MKKIIFLFSLLSIFSSCKQTQLTSKFNKGYKKIYVKPLIKNQHNYDLSKETNNKRDAYQEKKSIETISDNQEKLYVEVASIKPKVILKEKWLHQKLIRLDSILKFKDSTLSEKDEILETSKKAKKFSVLGLTSTLSSVLFAILNNEMRSLTKPGKLRRSILWDVTEIMCWILAGASFLLLVTSLLFIIKAIKKIKKNGEKIKNQNKTIRRNIKLAYLITLLLLIAPIVVGLIILLTFSSSYIGGSLI